LIVPFVACIFMITTTASAAAQLSSTDSEPVQLVLPETPCTVDTRHEDGDLGSWRWMDSVLGWQRTSSDSTMEFLVMLRPGWFSGCDVTISFDGLSNPNGAIAATLHFSAEFASAPQEPDFFKVDGLTMSDYNLYYTLESIPGDALPGTYTGAIVVSVTNTA